MTVTLLLSTFLPIQSADFTRFSHLPTYPGSPAALDRPPRAGTQRRGAGAERRNTRLNLIQAVQALYRSLSDRITQNDRHHAIQRHPRPLDKWDSNIFLWPLAVAVTEHR